VPLVQPWQQLQAVDTVCACRPEFGNGLADRLATSVTILLFGILTDRAFLYDWDPPPPAADVGGDIVRTQMLCSLHATWRHHAKHPCCPACLQKFYEPATHLWKALRSEFIDWRHNGVDVGNTSVVMDYNMDKDMDLYKALFAEQVCGPTGPPAANALRRSSLPSHPVLNACRTHSTPSPSTCM
jgi:hypothetical protein